MPRASRAAAARRTQAEAEDSRAGVELEVEVAARLAVTVRATAEPLARSRPAAEEPVGPAVLRSLSAARAI